MNFHLGLRQRLIAAPGIAAIVGPRVSWLLRPEGEALPAITLQIVTDARPQHLKGFDGARETRVQCDCWALTYAQALEMAEACIRTVARPGQVETKLFGAAQVDGPRDMSERSNVRGGNNITVYRQSVDFSIWHVGD